MQRMTVKNPNANTYRVPVEKLDTFRIESAGLNTAFMGTMVDKLGKYEDIGLTPEEIKEIIKEIPKYGKNNKEKVG